MKRPSRPSHDRIFPLSIPASVVTIVIIGFLVYANAVGHPFVHDDVVFILQNPFIARWDNIADAFLNPSIPQFFQGLVTPYYRPVLEVFYRLQYALFGFNPHGFHFFNILIHAANGFLLFGLLRKILQDNAALLIAVLFVVHPVQSEAVACVSGISNVLCAFFVLASLYMYTLSSEEKAGRRKLFLFAGSLVLFIIALFTKEQALFTIALFMAWERLFGRPKEGAMVRLYRLAILAVAAVGYISCRQLLFGPVGSAIFENVAELKLRLLSIPSLLETFIGILIVPAGLHYYRSINILDPYGPALVILIVLVVLTVMIMNRLPVEEKAKAKFGLVWFLVLLLPVLNIVPLVNEYSFVAAAEHGLYLPMVGFFIFLTTIVSCAFQARIRKHPDAVKAGLIIFIVVLGFLTVRQNAFWRGEIPLFERAVAFEPQLGRVHVLLAKAYMFNGRLDEAVHEFSRAKGIIRRYAKKATTSGARAFYYGLLKGIHADMAQCYLAQRNFPKAVRQYSRALKIDPYDSTMYGSRGLALIQSGDMAKGMRDLETALRLNPGNLLAANNLSICYIQQGQKVRAKDLLQHILKKDPSFAAARDNLKKLEQSGR